jgi:hypothetical protein
VLDDVSMEQDFGLDSVASAERMAADLSSGCIVSAGVEAAVWSAPEEPGWQRSSSSVMKRFISDSGTV